MGLLDLDSFHLDFVLFDAEVDNGTADLYSLVVQRNKRASLFDKYHSSKFRVVILKNEFTILKLDHGVYSGDGDVVYAQVSIVPSAQFEL